MAIGIGLSGIFTAKSAVPPPPAPINLFTQDLTLAANRTHDLNGNSVTFLKSNFEFRATNNDSTERIIGLRNYTNTSYYLEARNNGTLIHIGNIVQNNDTGSQSFLTNVTSNFTTGFEVRITGSGGNGFVVQRNGGSASVGLNITGNRGGFGIATFGMLSQYNVDGSVYSYDTDTYTQYAADRGGVAGKSSVHFRCEDGTVNVIGDLSGFGTITPTSRLEAQALNGNSGERVLGLRNHTNTGWLFDINNDGSGGYRVDGKIIYFGSGCRIQTGADSSIGWLLGFGLYGCDLVTVMNAANQDISNVKQLSLNGAFDSDPLTIAVSGRVTNPTSAIAGTYKQYGKNAGPVATNIVPHFYIYDYITPANSYTIQFFKGAPMTIPDGTLPNAVTRIAELEAKLQAYGLL